MVNDTEKLENTDTTAHDASTSSTGNTPVNHDNTVIHDENTVVMFENPAATTGPVNGTVDNGTGHDTDPVNDDTEGGPVIMSSTARSWRVWGGAALVLICAILTVGYVIGSMQLWYNGAWTAWVEVLIIVIMVLFLIGVSWAYAEGLFALRKGIKNKTIIIKNKKSR